MPAGNVSKKARTSEAFTTSAYFAFIHVAEIDRMACLRAVEAAFLRQGDPVVQAEASITVARTHPEVVVPVTMTLSQPSSVRWLVMWEIPSRRSQPLCPARPR